MTLTLTLFSSSLYSLCFRLSLSLIFSYFIIFLFSPYIRFCKLESFLTVSYKFLLEIYFILLAMINCVSNSKAEPNAISKNLVKSFSEFRDAPSAIFEGVQTADLVI